MSYFALDISYLFITLFCIPNVFKRYSYVVYNFPLCQKFGSWLWSQHKHILLPSNHSLDIKLFVYFLKKQTLMRWLLFIQITYTVKL